MDKIAITCELKDRDLMSLTILKKQLELKNYKVKLISSRILCGLQILFHRPDYLIVNGLRNHNNYLTQILSPKILFNTKIISLYSEQVGTKDGLYDSYNNPEILNSIDLHLTWGPLFATGLNKLGVPKERIKVIGSLAFDIPKYLIDKNKIRERLSGKYKLNAQKKWILISDNMIRFFDLVKQYDELRIEFDNVVLEISKKYHDCEIIFRPHPAMLRSDLNMTVETFRNSENVHIIKDEHIHIWISQISSMIVWRSTSAIDAWLCDVPVFAYQTNIGSFEYWHENLIENFKSSSELLSKIGEVLNNTYETPIEYIKNRKLYFSNWFYRSDSSASIRLVEAIENLKYQNISIENLKKLPKIKLTRIYLTEIVVLFKKIITLNYFRYKISSKDIRAVESSIIE